MFMVQILTENLLMNIHSKMRLQNQIIHMCADRIRLIY